MELEVYIVSRHVILDELHSTLYNNKGLKTPHFSKGVGSEINMTDSSFGN